MWHVTIDITDEGKRYEFISPAITVLAAINSSFQHHKLTHVDTKYCQVTTFWTDDEEKLIMPRTRREKEAFAGGYAQCYTDVQNLGTTNALEFLRTIT